MRLCSMQKFMCSLLKIFYTLQRFFPHILQGRKKGSDCLVKKKEMKKVDPFKRIAVHTALQQTHTVFSLLPEN